MQKFLKSFSYAFHGLATSWREERNFRIQFSVGTLVVILALFMGFSLTEWVMIVFAITLVLAAELANTATEEILDLLEKRHQHQVGKIKDVAAAAVLVFSLGALVIGALVFINHFRQ